MASSLEEYMEKKYVGKKKKPKHTESTDTVSTNVPDISNNENSNVLKNNSTTATLSPKEEVREEDVGIPEEASGLRNSEEIALEMKIKEERMRKELQKLKKLTQNDDDVVYRDSLGNVISKNEAKKEEENKDYKRKREIEREENIAKRNKNEAAIEKERQMRERLLQIKNEGINVYENDKELVEKQKAEIKEEDPALLFDKKIIKKHKSEIDKQFVSITGRKLYKDPTRYPINRFNIKPGWRWDGILRGNGFEQKWFDKNTK